MPTEITRRHHAMPFGTQVSESGVLFRIWASKCKSMGLKITGREAPLPLDCLDDGWHELLVPQTGVGTRYKFVLPDGLEVPDPASRFQPEDVHGPSQVVDPREYAWEDINWKGRPWEESVIYELHVGTFTLEGTFNAATERLNYLRELGISVIEVMPVADFPGERNWGYDGVLLFAPDSTYGRPEDFKAFVDAAHQCGISIILDVVYNHFGPDGNYLPSYSHFFTERHHTPWGAAINYDAEGSQIVRSFIVNNAVYWIREFNLDGLRLDAVHAIADDSPRHILEEIARSVREWGKGRHIHLILENEENQASRLARDAKGDPIEFTAQWNDDVHHVLHTAATGEGSGYYQDYVGDTAKLGRSLAEGFAFQGELMPYRGHPRGEPSHGLPPTAFVSFIQNHDQIGNRAFGDRLNKISSPEAVRAVAAIYLLAPQIPMLFMGEEWAASQPFAFFCDFNSDLAAAVRDGRRSEFAKFPEFQDPKQRERIPDPTDRSTFETSKLDWKEALEGAHAEQLEWYRRLLTLRRNEIAGRLRGIGGNSSRFKVLGEAAVEVSWTLADQSELVLLANLKPSSHVGVGCPAGRLLLLEGVMRGDELGPWTVAWWLKEAIKPAR